MRCKLILLVSIFLMNSVIAVSGVSPASYDIDFEENLEKEFIFDFFIDDFKILDLELQGDLADYFSLSSEKVAGRQKIVVLMKLPEKIDKPGINEVRVVAGNVVGVIKIRVPYPNEFIELDLSAPDVNEGETVDIKLDVLNKGANIFVKPRFEIYKFENESFKITSVINMNSSWVRDSHSFETTIVPGQYSAGEYVVVAHVEYSDTYAKTNNSFKVGEKRVEIINYTKSVKEGRVNKFNIGVKSFWNSDVKSVYAEVKILGTDYSFVTPSVSLEKWEEISLLGFFDARGISAENKKIEVTVYFDGSSFTQIYDLKVYEGFDMIMFLVIAVVGAGLFFVWWIFRRFKKNVEKIKIEEGN